MRPLHSKDLSKFLNRFSNFIDAEFRHIEIISPKKFELTFTGQDANRGYDWITIKFEFSDISDASILDNSKISHVDMSEGLEIEVINHQFTLTIKNSTFFITSAALKYEEGQF